MTSLEAGFPSEEHLVRLDRGRGRSGAGQSWNDATARLPSQAEPASQRHRMVFHFALINLLAISLFAAAMVQGWIGKIVTADATRLSVVIFGVLVVGLAMSAHRMWRTNRELNEARAPRPEDSRRPARGRGKSRPGSYGRPVRGNDRDRGANLPRAATAGVAAKARRGASAAATWSTDLNRCNARCCLMSGPAPAASP